VIGHRGPADAFDIHSWPEVVSASGGSVNAFVHQGKARDVEEGGDDVELNPDVIDSEGSLLEFW
jgi:hypothetical protein